MDHSGSVPSLPPETPATCLQQTPVSPRTGNTQIGAISDIRIYRDGLLLASCKARGIAPTRLFASIDPLPYPVTTRLEIEFVPADNSVPAISRLTATVMQRSSSGIELKIGSGLVNSASTRVHTRQ